MKKSTVLDTDVDGAYHDNIMNEKKTHKSQITDYDEEGQKLHWIHKIISNIESTIMGIYHGMGKEYIESYVHEYERRFNHRYERPKLTLSLYRILC